MNSGLFGDGRLRLSWTSVSGKPGLGATLAIKGELVATGFHPGAVVLISAEVTADQLPIARNGYLGSVTPIPVVLAHVKLQWQMDNPPPADEHATNLEALLRIDPSALEALEDCRQGRDFYLRVDTTVLLVDRGWSDEGRQQSVPDAHYNTHPTVTWQDQIQVTQHAWAQVLQQWGRGVGIPLVVPLAAVTLSPERAEVVRHLRDAWQKVDGADYPGSIAATRKALELLRGLSPAATPIPKQAKTHDVDQRVHAVLDALYSLASAPAHTDGSIKDYVPLRADAVAAVAGAAATAQQIFARLPMEL